MKTSRASLDRMPDPGNPSLAVISLSKSVGALGKKEEFRLLPAG